MMDEPPDHRLLASLMKVRSKHDCKSNGTSGCPMCMIVNLAKEVVRLKASLRNQASKNHSLRKLDRRVKDARHHSRQKKRYRASA